MRTLPSNDADGSPLPVTYPDAASWKVATDATAPQILRLHLTDVPGWHASIDGKPLPLFRFNRVMLQAKIPPGKHIIELHYWPETFTVGIVVAAVTVIVLIVVLAFGARWWRRWGGRTSVVGSVPDASGPAPGRGPRRDQLPG